MNEDQHVTGTTQTKESSSSFQCGFENGRHKWRMYFALVNLEAVKGSEPKAQCEHRETETTAI